MNIRKLEAEVKKNGFMYHLIERDNEQCIYAQKSNGLIIAYEVFKSKLSSPHPLDEKTKLNFDKVETFPSNEEFGKRAWTYSTIEKAKIRYDALKEQQNATRDTALSS